MRVLIGLMLILIVLPARVLGQDLAPVSTRDSLPLPEAIGPGWVVLRTYDLIALGEDFREGSSAAYGGPRGKRALVAVLQVADGMGAARGAWQIGNKLFDDHRTQIDNGFDTSREQELQEQALPDGCDDARRTFGEDKVFGDVIPISITLCAIEPDIIVLAYVSGEVNPASGVLASDQVALEVFEKRQLAATVRDAIATAEAELDAAAEAENDQNP